MSVTAQRYEADAALADLIDHPRNPRRGADDSVADSIDRNGFYGAIVAQESTRMILAGHTRRRALTAAGVERAPVLWVSCDDETATRILLADNRTAELASWDEPALAALLQEMDADALAASGFTVGDAETMMRRVEKADSDRADYDAEWERAGMPDYDSENRMPVYSTTVHFGSDADADEFFRMLERPRVRSWWWPDTDGHVGQTSKVEVKAEAVA